MKFTVDVDCTPEEARRFIGLPDLAPVHAAYLDRMRGMIEQGITPDALQAIMKSWGPMGEAGMTMWRNLLGHLDGERTKSRQD